MKVLIILIALICPLPSQDLELQKWFGLPTEFEKKLLEEAGASTVLAVYKVAYVKDAIGEILSVKADLEVMVGSPGELKKGLLNVNVAFVKFPGKDEKFFYLSVPVQRIAEIGLSEFPEGICEYV